MRRRCSQVPAHQDTTQRQAQLGWVQAVLYNIQNGTTVDLLSEIWGAFLRRCVRNQDILLAMYFFKEYSETLSVKDLRSMHVSSNEQYGEQKFFLSWTGGFAICPGSNTGSLSAEAAHSPWQSELKRLGRNWEVEDTLVFMQQLYSETWHNMYNWSHSTHNLNIIPDSKDPQIINGTHLHYFEQVHILRLLSIRSRP